MLEAAYLAEAQSDCSQNLSWRLAQMLTWDTDTQLLSEWLLEVSANGWLLTRQALAHEEDPAQRHEYGQQGGRGEYGYLPQPFMQLKSVKDLLYADPVFYAKLIDLSNFPVYASFLTACFYPSLPHICKLPLQLKRVLMPWKGDIILRASVFMCVPEPCVNVRMMYMHVWCIGMYVYAEACAPGD